MTALEWMSAVALILIVVGLVASIREDKQRRATARRELTRHLRGVEPDWYPPVPPIEETTKNENQEVDD